MEYVFFTLGAILFCVFIALLIYTNANEGELDSFRFATSLLLSVILSLIFFFVAGSIDKQKDYTCPECGNVAYSKYCDECGYHMDKAPTCPSCGSQWDSAYCGDCGASMPPQT